jgi:hypothetical protein
VRFELSLRTIARFRLAFLSLPSENSRIARVFLRIRGQTRVQPQAGTTPTPKVKRKRRGIRLNSRVPVAIEWKRAEATPACREEAFTRVVGPYGCLVVLRRNLAIEQALRVVNLATKETNPAQIVWKGNERPDGWELGIELIQPPMDFWGMGL